MIYKKRYGKLFSSIQINLRNLIMFMSDPPCCFGNPNLLLNIYPSMNSFKPENFWRIPLTQNNKI